MTNAQFAEGIKPHVAYFSGTGRQTRIMQRLSALGLVKPTEPVTPRAAAWILLANACAPTSEASKLAAWLYEASDTWQQERATPLNWLAYILGTPDVLSQVENIFLDQYSGQLLVIFHGGKAAQSEGGDIDETYVFHNIVTITAPALQLLSGLLRADATAKYVPDFDFLTNK